MVEAGRRETRGRQVKRGEARDTNPSVKGRRNKRRMNKKILKTQGKGMEEEANGRIFNLPRPFPFPIPESRIEV